MSSGGITFLRLLHSHVMLINELTNYMLVCFSKSFSKTNLAHPSFKVLDLNIHVKHFTLFFSLKPEK